MASAVEQPLHGFMVNGYRSFYGAPQKIAPLGKMNLFAGTNNSGKSNVLLAAKTWIPLCGAGTSTIELAPLDRPQLRGEASTEPPPPTVGIAVPISYEELTELLRQKSNSQRKRHEDFERLAALLLRLPELSEEHD